MELCDMTAFGLHKMLINKECTSEEILHSIIRRIDLVDGDAPTIDYPDSSITNLDLSKIHAYISLYSDSALEQARNIDKRINKGDIIKPLEGIPLAIKDNICVINTKTTAASKMLATYIAPYDATCVARLRSQGAIVLGKTNLDEFAFGSSTESSAFQPSTANPWDPYRVPGGSSGGSAAAIASGEAIIALGSDTAGSIRQPAAFCGVVGLKPTYGLVSRYGLIALASSLDCVGTLTKDVYDAALMLNVISGHDPYDATTKISSVPDYTAFLGENIKGLRIGKPIEYFNDPQMKIDSDIIRAIEEAERVLIGAGAIIIDVSMPHTKHAIPCYFVTSRAEASSNLQRYDGVKYGYRMPNANDLEEMYRLSRGKAFGKQVKLRILMGLFVLSSESYDDYYIKAQYVRQLIRQDFDNVFKTVDCLLTPSTPTSAFPRKIAIDRGLVTEEALFGDSIAMQYADRLAVPANHAGVPSMTLPCGFDEQGLPIGLQLIGRPFDEKTMLKIAYVYEQETSWHLRRPNRSLV